MAGRHTDSSADRIVSRPFLPLILALFVGSGLCALIYEVVWFQLLELVIGSSAVSLGVLLATFMGGMCAGSLGLPRVISPKHHPLKVYASLEAAIGLLAVVVLFAVPLIGRLYSPSMGHGLLALLIRAAICAICLLPPTILMGATLPAVARWIESSPKGVAWLGFFYGGNIAGAVLGCVVAGFYLLRAHDLVTATVVAAAVNLSVAGVALFLSQRTPGRITTGDTKSFPEPEGARTGWPIYVTIGLSGACALGAEVVWTRLLSLMLGASVYAFSLILAVFLVGLGGGSAAGASIARVSTRPRIALAWCQLAQAATVGWAAFMISRALPYWPVNPSLAPSFWFSFHLDISRVAWTVLPASLLWGASFPLALASVATRGQDAGKLVGSVYAANTIGAIVGALSFSLIFIPGIGTQHSQQLLIAASALSALLVFGSIVGPEVSGGLRPAGIVSALVGLAVATTITLRVPEIPAILVAYGRYAVTWLNQVDVLYTGEGMNSSIAVTKLKSSGATQFHVSGKVEASSLAQDMRLQRMLAHLPALVHPNPKSVLVVGFGAGVTAGSFVPYPDMNRLVICEIEPLIPKVVAKYFTRENNDVLRDKRTQVFYDDARSFILTTDEKFDIITSDPIHPWVKGAASLYTREYFEAVKRHLNPGGVVSQWVPLYESNLDAVRSEIATFLEVFPNGTVWANNLEGRGYDVVLLGQVEPAKVELSALQQRFARPEYAQVGASLREVGFMSEIDLFSTFAGMGSDLHLWLQDAAINTDRNLRLQYLAGVGLNRYQEGAIYNELVNFRKFPDDLFVAPPEWKEALRTAMLRAP